MSEDPIGFLGGDANLLRYVENNPATRTDPSGNGIWAGLQDFAKDVTEGLIYMFGGGLGQELDNQYEGKEDLYEDLANPDLPPSADPTKERIKDQSDISDSGAKSIEVLAEGCVTFTAGGPGFVTPTGTRVTGFAKHGIDRVIGDGGKRAGTRPDAILDALKNPKKVVRGVDSQGRPFEVFTGASARVVVNPQTGQIVSVNPTSGAGAHLR